MIYLDNAATTWPKPDETISAMMNCIKNAGANPGRGGHKMALAAGKEILTTRELISNLLGASNPSRVVFTKNATESLNLALKGLLRDGDHVITTSMEHNAVARPLHVLKKQGVSVTVVECDSGGFLDPSLVSNQITKRTKAIVMSHASNVTGTIQPVEEVGKISKDNGLIFIVDAAQTAGHLELNVQRMGVDLLAFTGHKSLYGPQGTGGLVVGENISLVPLMEGGTGSQSEMLEQPEDLPDRLESGTPNTPGIAGLGGGVRFLAEKSLEAIRQHETELTKRFLDGLKQIKDIEIYGSQKPELQVPVVSINVKDKDPSEVAFVLDRVYGIACRSGLHCSPMAHKTIGTLERGALRFSFSYFNSLQEVEKTISALEETVDEL